MMNIEVRNNPIILTNSPTQKLIQVREFGIFLIVVQNSDCDEEKMEPMFHDNDNSINNEPILEIYTVIDDNNKYGVIVTEVMMTLYHYHQNHHHTTLLCRVSTLLI